MTRTTRPTTLRRGLLLSSVGVAAVLAVALAGCANADSDAAPAPSAPASTSAASSPTPTPAPTVVPDGEMVTGVGPTIGFPGVDFPLSEGAKSVIIDFTCDGGAPYVVELGDSMLLAQGTLMGTCEGTRQLAWPIVADTAPHLQVTVPETVEWSATPHFSADEFMQDAALAVECKTYSEISSAFSNADQGLMQYQAFEEDEWTTRVDGAAADLAALAASSTTGLAETYSAIHAGVTDPAREVGAITNGIIGLDEPIRTACNDNHSPVVGYGEFGG